ncbi:MAG: hypothetical protein MRY83_03750 [Flavobacteriales bacterium]|nr:hypothetical protein [Flavobacteriales bacterium]
MRLSFLEGPIMSIQKLGLSYILFRYIHWLVECYRGTIKKMNPLVFLNYILFFPTILAGPIDTYRNFHYWLASNRKTYQKSLFFAGIARVFLGAAKTLLIVPPIKDYALDYQVLSGDLGIYLGLATSLLCYSAYIYFDFSGYSDIAIGTAMMLGIRIPENFNNPYFSIDLATFWRKWHITFSNFLRAYIFKPTLHVINKTIIGKNRILTTISAYLLTFFICGIWHGDKVNFIYWGLFHGLGLSLNKIWRDHLVSHTIQKLRWYKLTSGFVTFAFVTLGWMFFHYSHEELVEIFNAL